MSNPERSPVEASLKPRPDWSSRLPMTTRPRALMASKVFEPVRLTPLATGYAAAGAAAGVAGAAGRGLRCVAWGESFIFG